MCDVYRQPGKANLGVHNMNAVFLKLGGVETA